MNRLRQVFMLSPTTAEKVEQHCEKEGITKAMFYNLAIAHYLKQNELSDMLRDIKNLTDLVQNEKEKDL